MTAIQDVTAIQEVTATQAVPATESVDAAAAGGGAASRELYLDLLQRVLVNSIYQDPGMLYPDGSTREEIANHREVVGFDAKRRLNGFDFPTVAHTMIGTKRLDNVRHCMERVLEDGVPGDVIETGVWRGGTVIFMRGILQAFGVTDRTVWVADSFQGLPPADAAAYPADVGIPFDAMTDVLGVSAAQVRENFRRYGLLDDQVRFLEGFFRDTLPVAPIDRLAVLRLDGDMYESTINALDNLYPKLSPGGYLIIDDYRLVPACRQAVNDYRDRHGISEPVRAIDACGAFWRRES